MGELRPGLGELEMWGSVETSVREPGFVKRPSLL